MFRFEKGPARANFKKDQPGWKGTSTGSVVVSSDSTGSVLGPTSTGRPAPASTRGIVTGPLHPPVVPFENEAWPLLH